MRPETRPHAPARFGGRGLLGPAITATYLGLIVLILIPMIAIILMATLVGLTVGFAILLTLPALLVFGHAVAATGIAAGLFVLSLKWLSAKIGRPELRRDISRGVVPDSVRQAIPRTLGK